MGKFRADGYNAQFRFDLDIDGGGLCSVNYSPHKKYQSMESCTFVNKVHTQSGVNRKSSMLAVLWVALS